jgi:hypothetical protein
MSTTTTTGVLDQNLRYISVRSQWGCQPIANNILTIDDKGLNDFFDISCSSSPSLEYLCVVGSRVTIHEEDQAPSGSRKLLYPGPEVLQHLPSPPPHFPDTVG